MHKLKPVFKSLLRPLAVVAVSLLTFAIILELPALYQTWLRHKVASRVFEIKGDKDSGGGTGFQIDAPSGTSYIITNSHVCELAIKDGHDKNFLLVEKDGHSLKRQIIEISEFSDLCLVQGWPNLSGLNMGPEVEVGHQVIAIGHPLLGPTTMTFGEVTSMSDMKLLHHIMKTGNPRVDLLIGAEDDGTCSEAKNEIIKETIYFMGTLPLGTANLCLVNELDAIHTNATIFPGSSGSPMVNKLGEVVGVMFASNKETHWGSAVNLRQLHAFLADF